MQPVISWRVYQEIHIFSVSQTEIRLNEMTSPIYFVVMFVLVLALFGHLGMASFNDENWNNFKTKYGKTYHNPSVEAKRKNAYHAAVRYIEAHNANPNKTFTLAINKFADLEPAEFAARMTGYKASRSRPGSRLRRQIHLPVVIAGTAPATKDWRTVGWVTPVKNQGQCKASWAFSATGALEGMQKNRTGTLISLSEQNLIDCAEQNSGCDGGDMETSFEYVKDNGGLDTEASYPYEGYQDECKYDAANSTVAGLTGYVNLPQGDETALRKAVGLVGPISVAIDGSHLSFQFYAGGIYIEDDTCSNSELDHAVLVVGYGTNTLGNAYWILKNSWGTDWGEDGYFRLARNSGNVCGVATDASYPKYW